jgi:hypothetical protein
LKSIKEECLVNIEISYQRCSPHVGYPMASDCFYPLEKNINKTTLFLRESNLFQVRVQNPWSGGAGIERSGALQLRSAPPFFFDTALHRSAPLHLNFWTYSGLCILYFSKMCLNTVLELRYTDFCENRSTAPLRSEKNLADFEPLFIQAVSYLEKSYSIASF